MSKPKGRTKTKAPGFSAAIDRLRRKAYYWNRQWKEEEENARVEDEDPDEDEDE